MNDVTDPFADRTFKHRVVLKRNQRSRSSMHSRINNMTVGDIRYCFQQLRIANAQNTLTSDMILYNGKSAGLFALLYLSATSNIMREKRKKKVNFQQQQSSSLSSINEPDSSHLPPINYRREVPSNEMTF
jgi:hypothetical protein